VTADEISLTFPRSRDFHRIAHLVLGGLAVRLDLTFEHLEDLQLALAELLAEPEAPGEVTVRLRVAGGAVQAAVGPFSREHLRRRLDDDGGRSGLGLRRMLDTVVDGVLIEEAAEGDWIEITKHVERAASR
jgi:anti-sigma regulatory factor (Ser/Thr protein kinase)